MPPVGGPDGASLDTPNNRIMEAFGSTRFPAPLLATAARINTTKGKIMRFSRPFTITNIERLAKQAVKADGDEAVKKLLTPIRSVSYPFSLSLFYLSPWLTSFLDLRGF
ncbi:hypothetical protein P175DRAFT_096024 [Aspergillus ochraceoroseus IBT 24754]|uniref:Uncharacterized protein n=1 Tax=Aspergillus ochraceoroseus IBT 24754 TaxID=1392256 RepID=A0A2T5LMP4_9EURO|nr:uncharacterized protein P175DRAFT_096024 [Aspergillus ochraceoroseus IBT 24754]PTU17560.1 hypothetical protein P175DRAFT_096024 [Aspergillus ochraceoroseus IBT 24754]